MASYSVEGSGHFDSESKEWSLSVSLTLDEKGRGCAGCGESDLKVLGCIFICSDVKEGWALLEQKMKDTIIANHIAKDRDSINFSWEDPPSSLDPSVEQVQLLFGTITIK